MPRARLRNRLPPEARREQLLAAAATVLTRGDFDGFTFEEVAAEAGVSRALVYNYFNHRGQLLAALYLRAVEALDRALVALAEFRGPPDAWARELCDIYVQAVTDDPALWQRTFAAGTSFYPGLVDARVARFDGLATAWGAVGHPPGLVRMVVGMIEARMVDALDHRDDPAQYAGLLTVVLAAALESSLTLPK